MDGRDLRALLAEIEEARQRADAAMWFIGPGRRPAEIRNAVETARAQLARMSGILEAAREEDDMRRRDLLKLVPLLAVPPSALERMASAHRTDDALLDAYQEVIMQASLAYHSAHMADLYGVVGPHVARLADRLRGEMGERHRRRLGRIVAETAVLAGWNALIVGRPVYARAHYRLAEQAALLASSGDLQALAVEAQANLDSSVFYGRWHPAPLALQGLERAASLLDGSAPPIARQWVLSRLAHEMAAAGDERFMAVVEHARALPALPGEQPTGLHVPGGYWASGARLNDIEAVGLTMTGRADRAERMMLSEMEATPSSLPRRHVGIAIILAHVHVGQKEPDEAARVALRALDLAESRASALDVQRVDGVARRLARWDVPAVRDLNDRLATM